VSRKNKEGKQEGKIEFVFIKRECCWWNSTNSKIKFLIF